MLSPMVFFNSKPTEDSAACQSSDARTSESISDHSSYDSTSNSNSNADAVAVATMNLPGNAAIREFMDKVTASTNVSKYVELPMIAVMGDTSSGKSSLLSSISMVELPSGHELTTRCPVLLQMTKSDTTGASVNIQWRQTPNGHKPEDIAFTERTVDASEWETLPNIIAQAQEHIIHYSGKEVARDIVHVKVFGPDCHDLTLIDLPGIVRSHGVYESEAMVRDVGGLIEDYLRNSRCVILAVVPANVDFHNSQIMGDAQKVDPDTARTIPVITKPDLIDKGAENDVRDLLLGQKMSFALGFHMVKGRGQAALDRSETIATGLLNETQFFETAEPWKDVQDRELFGTSNLRKKLGDLQMNMIQETIPGILKEISTKRQSAMDKLAIMGGPHPTIADKRRCYQDICQLFLTNLKASLSGKGRSGKRNSEPSAAAKLHENCSIFMKSIREGSLGTIKTIVEGAQVLVISEKGDIHGDIVHVGNGYACVDFVDKKDRTCDVLFDYVGYHSEETLETDNVWSDGSKVFIARESNAFDLLKNIPLSKIRTDPSWLQEKIADNRTDDLACFLNVDIFKNIVAEFIEEDWSPHCLGLVDNTSDIVQSAVMESLEKTQMSSSRYPKLRDMIRTSSRQAANQLIADSRRQIRSHLEIEKHPYTQDHILFEHIASARHRGIKRELEAALRLDQAGAFDTDAIKTIMEGVFERNHKKTVEEHMAEDMEIVLESYGKVATKRVIDRTPMVCWEVFRTLGASVQDSLWNTTDEQLEMAMQDSPDYAQTHEELTDELMELNKAMSIFQSLVSEGFMEVLA